MESTLAAQAAQLPTQSGVYLFRDAEDTVLYVGKAINLRSRVRQYLGGHDERFMVPFLVAAAARIEVVVTTTEKEALLLENTLIKQHRPRYNTQLRDDKEFLHLRIDPARAWPRFHITRKVRDDGARYFGPYASAAKARHTLEVLGRHFPLRTCTDAVLKSRKRPCLLHQMGRCAAPCVGLVTRDAYLEIVAQAALALEGRSRDLIDRLRDRMIAAAEAEDFEEAARLRDVIADVTSTLERQAVVDVRMGDRDVWGLHRSGARGAVAILPVREGRVGQPHASVGEGWLAEDGELLSSLINATYAEGAPIPPELWLPTLPHDAEALAEVLGERRGGKVRILAPSRGEKRRQVELANGNAEVRFTQRVDEEQRRGHALAELAEAIGLPAPPRRIECFDNSNLLGESAVAAMSVFIDGKPAREAYRRYRVKTVVGADDFASMAEVVGRRLRRGVEEGALPDLIVVDGGRGQLNAALEARASLGLTAPPIIGISKPRTEHRRGEREATDKLVLPDREEPVRLPAHHPGLRVLQHLRDEVHQHAIRYHRQVRGKNALVTVLEAIPGVGATRRRALLRALGSAEAVAQASPEELAAVAGIGDALAATIHRAFRPN